MAISLFPRPKARFFDDDGTPLNGGKVYFYIPGTANLKDTYTTEAGTIANSNPVVLDANGRAEIWLNGVYDVRLDRSDDTTVWTVDNVSSAGAASAASAISEWIAPGDTPTFIDTTNFSVTGDQRTTYQVGRRVKCTETAGTVYGRVSAVAFTTITTVTVVLDSGTLDTGLSVVDVGILSRTNSSIPTIPDAASLESIVAAQQIIKGELTYIDDTGAADVYVMALPIALTAYVKGMRIFTEITNANATTTPTLNVNALGAKTIKREGGTALLVGDLPVNHLAEFEYDGTDMILKNPAQDDTVRYALDTGAADVYAIAPAPALAAYRTGLTVIFKVVNANATTTPTLNVNGLGTKTIKKEATGVALVADDMPAGHWAECVYDGTDFILQNPVFLNTPALTLSGSAASPPDPNTLTKENIVKAWAHVTYSGGTPTLANSINVSGIVDGGVGLITLQWDTDFANATYAIGGTIKALSGSEVETNLCIESSGATPLTTADADMAIYSTVLYDPLFVTFMAIGDQ